MGISVIPAPSAASKTMYRTTLTSGTSWTVPAGVTYVNVTLHGGGGGGRSGTQSSWRGYPGQMISSTLSTTPGASISYAIGAGGGANSSGGTTTFTGATSASGGGPGPEGYNPGGATSSPGYDNGGQGGYNPGGAQSTGATGGSGRIDIEYWL